MRERLSRAAVVTHAADLADRVGLDAVTLTRLARELGIAPPGMYRHVTDVHDLRRAIGEHAAREAASVLATASAGLSGAAALCAVAHTLRDWAAAHPGRYAAVQVAPLPTDVDGRAASKELLAVIAAALRSYELDGDDLTDALRFLRSTIHGFIALERSGGFRQPRDLDATFGRIVEALDSALTGWVH